MDRAGLRLERRQGLRRGDAGGRGGGEALGEPDAGYVAFRPSNQRFTTFSMDCLWAAFLRRTVELCYQETEWLYEAPHVV